MILDWSTHCYKIYKTKKVCRSDPSDNKSIFSQESHYIKFLTLRGMTYKDAFFQWVKIKNGMASVFKDDPEQQVATFARIYRSSTNISDKVFKQHYGPIKIYQSEINFLNSVQAPVWTKQYWMAMLVYWKFASQHTKNVEINGTLCNWAMRQSCAANKKFGRHQDEIAKYNYDGNRYVLRSGIAKIKNKRIYWFDWALDKSDEKFVEIINLDKIKKVLTMLVERSLVCPKCGKKFKASCRQQTDMCPDCYKKVRRQYKTKKDIERYHAKKLDTIEIK